MTTRTTLTRPGGPVVISEKTLRALLAIRREKLLPELFGRVVLSRANFASFHDTWPSEADLPPWLSLSDDAPHQPLPDRVQTATPSEAATLRTALAIGASEVLLEGPIKERAKLSFIKSEGTLSVLVTAYRAGKLSAVEPMVKALRSLGHGDVLPEQPMLDAMFKALRSMADS